MMEELSNIFVLSNEFFVVYTIGLIN